MTASNVTLFGKLGFVDAVKARLGHPGLGGSYPMTSIHTRGGKFEHRDAREKVMTMKKNGNQGIQAKECQGLLATTRC